ncbi:MAG: NAD(P)/FAD-dependent oxidoreductase [Planctomycetota bacterium]|jgi:hypothetical protein|nr:NAD(P)/FAD-dependent oxidoreductase [Planctomycetota bacterium]MDP6941315.1 NAD(P)/FAD-dependent oxidoreductase [Planctomycetota bacterium]
MIESCTLRLSAADNPTTLEIESLYEILADHLGVSPEEITYAKLVRYSFDARVRQMQWNAAYKVWINEEPSEEDSAFVAEPELPSPPSDSAPHAVIVGAGPAGLFCALELLRAGVQVTLCERGLAVQERRKDIANLNKGMSVNPDSNYCFGEGGAGTFSDGKLFTRSGRKSDVRTLLEEFVAFGAPADILSNWRPHVGSNLLPKVVANIRESLQKAGANIRFGTRVVEILTKNDSITGVRVATDGGEEEIPTSALIMAHGHSSLDTLLMLKKAGAEMEAKGFAMGVRVEHPQSWVDDLQYQGLKKSADLPAAFYELASKAHERGVYSFCMCPGGWIVPSHTGEGRLSVNGMSLAKRDSPFANSGCVVSIEPKDWCGKRGSRWGWDDLLRRAAAVSDAPILHEVIKDPKGGNDFPVAEGRLPIHPDIDPLFGIRLQWAMEVLAAHAGGGKNKAPVQSCFDFINNPTQSREPEKTSYLPGLTPVNMSSLLPKGIANRLLVGMMEFDKKMEGYIQFGQMIGAETRTSSPVRVLRERETQENTTLKGLFPCGEGAGYAGGIMSAALDGKRVASSVANILKGLPLS